jgi:tape measure domain-containing protein
MTEVELQRLVVRLVGDISQYQSSMNQAVATTQQTGSAINASLGASGQAAKSSWLGTAMSVVSGVGMATLAIQGVSSAINTLAAPVQWGVGLAAQAEQATIAFGTMLGSAEAGQKMVKNIRDFAAATPMSTSDLTQAAKTLMQFGVAGDNVLPIMKMLGDVTGGDSQRFSMLSLAFGQMSASGRLMGQDLLQMINAGFNPLQEMAKTTGKSMGQLKADMEAGRITTDMVIKAFQSATSAGGQFDGMMQKQSQSMSGLWSTFNDGLAIAAMSGSEKLLKVLNVSGFLQAGINFLDRWNYNFEANYTALTVWLTALWNSWAGYFGVSLDSMSSAATSWWSYFAGTAVAGLSNVIGFFVNFNENVSLLWGWLGDNWLNLLTDLGAMFLAYATNQINNYRVIYETFVKLSLAFYGWLGQVVYNSADYMYDVFLTALIGIGEATIQMGVVMLDTFDMVADQAQKIWDWSFKDGLVSAIQGGLRNAADLFNVFANGALGVLTSSFSLSTIQKIIKGEDPGIIGDAFAALGAPIVNGLEKGFASQNLASTMGGIIDEGLRGLKNPLEGFQSSLTDLPSLNLGVDGMDLPKFAWEQAKLSNDAFAKGVTGMANPMIKEMGKLKPVEGVAANSAEALARILDFEAGKVTKSAAMVAKANAQKPFDNKPIVAKKIATAEGTTGDDQVASGIDRLVQLAEQYWQNTATDSVEIVTGGVV